MIFYHADDYGISVEQSEMILKCKKRGCLNSVSIIPNSDRLDVTMPLLDSECKKAIHVNLCEGKALLGHDDIPLLVDTEGSFNRSFLQLLFLSLIHGRELEDQVEKECYAQINKVLTYLPDDYKLRIDSHRHYHMIPCVLRGLVKAMDKTGREVEYFRTPCEKAFIYLLEPRLWVKLSPLSIVKAIVLNTCGCYNRSFLKKKNLLDKTHGYIGVVFTDRMYYDNIAPFVCKIKKGSIFKGQDVEIQFHPGGIKKEEELLDPKFGDWYASDAREKEADALMRFER